MTTSVPTVRNLKRMKSAIEQQASRKKPPPRAMECSDYNGNPGQPSQVGASEGYESSSTGPIAKQKPTRTCGLCRRQGHTVMRCHILERFGGSLLPIRRASSKLERDQLASDLSEPHKFNTFKRPVGSTDIIHNEFPKRGDHDCIIIHRRLYIDDGRMDVDMSDNFCFECTVLHGTVQGVDETYSRKLFSLNAVKNAVTSNQNSLIKSELSFSAQNLPLSQSNLSLSQSTYDR